ncbi:hypothetical protein FRUB_03367 [Fimbriiglobus ruber]|uniref:Uncharacterized protein n=1 Tax=Fimbriiglobus ruber TaxID=1908690 RepID=A0A225DZ15_9BACT|nr:hypothetical protein FRUB_03367 [Fimbriiglobus ruber]
MRHEKGRPQAAQVLLGKCPFSVAMNYYCGYRPPDFNTDKLLFPSDVSP